MCSEGLSGSEVLGGVAELHRSHGRNRERRWSKEGPVPGVVWALGGLGLWMRARSCSAGGQVQAGVHPAGQG